MSAKTARAKRPAATSSSMMPVPSGRRFELADGPGFEDVEEAEEEESEDGVRPVGGAEDEGDELAGYLVDDYVAGVFAAGFAGYYGGGGDADQRGEDCGDGVSEGEMSRVKGLRGGDTRG